MAAPRPRTPMTRRSTGSVAGWTLAVDNSLGDPQHQQAADGHDARERVDGADGEVDAAGDDRVDAEVSRPRAIDEPPDHRGAEKTREITDRVDQGNASRRGRAGKHCGRQAPELRERRRDPGERQRHA